LEKTSLGQRIRESRIEKGYTQQALANKAGIGLMYLGEIERGIKMPSLSVFIKIVDALDISADYVLRDELKSGEQYVYDDLTSKLTPLSPGQRKAAAEILDAYIRNL
jgi:transcriptional regulator with XRE-family HTH domain